MDSGSILNLYLLNQFPLHEPSTLPIYAGTYSSIQMFYNTLSVNGYHMSIQLPYLSVLKPGSNACRGSNTRWVVQQNERNKRLDLFKRRVSKLLNLINLKTVPNVMENKLILNISLDVCISLSDVAIVDHL